MTRMQAAEQLRKALQIFAATLTDEQAMAVATVYPAWTVNTAYAVGDIISYGTNGVGDPQLYKVVQAHTSQAQCHTDARPLMSVGLLFDQIHIPRGSHPSGAHDAYSAGDIVYYNGTLYTSAINGNVWSPDVYPASWTVYEAATEPEKPEPEPEEPTTYPEWVQPTGAHDAYHVGDRVTYNGKVYESTMNGNVYSPDAYPAGWKEVA